MRPSAGLARKARPVPSSILAVIACSATLGLLDLPLLTAPSTLLAATIHEFPTPTGDSSPTDLQFDSEGRLWFTMIKADKLERLDPAQARPGESIGITEYLVPTSDSNPHYLTLDGRGRIWFTERTGNKLRCARPGDGTDPRISDPA